MAHIVSYSGGTTARNFTLGQTMYNYDFFNRATTTDGNGDPALSTPTADEVLQATLQHVVATYSPVDGRRIYVNGELRTTAGPGAGRPVHRLERHLRARARQRGQQRPHLAGRRAHGRDPQPRADRRRRSTQNFDAGVGERFYLLFSVSHLVNVPQSYVMFEASQFDSYSYLFNKPAFISLDGSAGPGPDPHPGHAHRRQRRRGQGRPGLRAARPHGHRGGLRAGDRLRASRARHGGRARQGPVRGRVLPDLRADRHATRHAFDEPAPTPLPPPPDGDPASEIGLRTFEEISASMSSMTGVADDERERRRDLHAGCASSCRRSRTSRASCPRTRWEPRSSRSSTATSSSNDSGPARRVLPGLQLRRRAATAFDTPAERAQITGPLVARAVGTAHRVAADCRRNHGGSRRADRQAHDLRRQLRRRSHGSSGQGGLFGGRRQRQHAAAMRCLQR